MDKVSKMIEWMELDSKGMFKKEIIDKAPLFLLILGGMYFLGYLILSGVMYRNPPDNQIKLLFLYIMGITLVITPIIMTYFFWKLSKKRILNKIIIGDDNVRFINWKGQENQANYSQIKAFTTPLNPKKDPWQAFCIYHKKEKKVEYYAIDIDTYYDLRSSYGSWVQKEGFKTPPVIYAKTWGWFNLAMKSLKKGNFEEIKKRHMERY